MNLRQCLGNLKADINNGGIKEDAFAVTCYITMANKARRLLRSGEMDKQEAGCVKEYLTLCRDSGSDALRCVVER